MDVAVAGIFVADGIIAVGGTETGVLVLGTITGTVAVLRDATIVNWAATVWAAAVMAVLELCESGSFEGRLQAESMRVATRITETVRGVFFISLLLWKFNINSTASSHGMYPPFSEKEPRHENWRGNRIRFEIRADALFFVRLSICGGRNRTSNHAGQYKDGDDVWSHEQEFGGDRRSQDLQFDLERVGKAKNHGGDIGS